MNMIKIEMMDITRRLNEAKDDMNSRIAKLNKTMPVNLELTMPAFTNQSIIKKYNKKRQSKNFLLKLFIPKSKLQTSLKNRNSSHQK